MAAIVASKTAPAQLSQPSRKGKKAWRKNVDVSEIQAGLDQARDEKVLGGIVSEKPSDELFVLDTAGSEDIKKKHLKGSKPLKADEIIAARASALPALDTRKRKSLEVAAPASKKAKKNTYVPQQELQRLKAIGSEAADESVVALNDASYDPWAVAPKVQDERFSFLEEKQPAREPRTLKHAPVSLAASGKPFAAVRKPGEGKSYNPSYDEWERHVATLGAKEVEAERQRLREEREEAERLAKAWAEAAKPDPVSDEEYESAWESEWEGIQSEGEEKMEALSQKRPERKTQAERNKIKKRKEAERLAKHEAAMKKRDAQEKRIAEIAREMRKRDAQQAQQLVPAGIESSDESGEDEVLRRRRLGKNAIPDAPLEVVLADELQDSLRSLKPEGNLLKDRFRHQLINGRIESRKPAMHKKPMRERTEKWSYKDWTLR